MNVTLTDLSTVSLQQENNDSLGPNNSVELGVYITLEICIALFAFTDNLLVIIALWKFRSLRTPTNRFVASLAVADIAVAAFAIPSAILLRLGLSVKNSQCEPVEGLSVGQGMCLVMALSVLFLTQVSIFSLVVIAIDRFIAISYPFRYHVFMTKSKTLMGIVAAWILGGLIGFASTFGRNKREAVETCDCKRCAFEEVIRMEYMVYFNFFGCILAPLLALGVMYLVIFRSAKNQLRKIYFDVKDLKRKRRDARSSDFLGNLKQAASSAVTELKNGHRNRRKLFHQEQHPTSSGDDVTRARKIHTFRPVSQDMDQYLSRNSSVDSNCPEIKVDTTEEPRNSEFKSPAKNAGNSEFKSSAKNSEEIISGSFKYLPTHYGDETGEDRKLYCGDFHTLPPRGVKEFTSKAMDFRRHYKACSLSCEDNSTNNNHICGLNEDHEHDLRPRGKAHSFSASSSVPKPFRHKTRQSTYHVKATPIGELDESNSLNSSRSTVYAAEHGVWSTVEGSTCELQRRMTRKRQLLKKEFRAARSLATVVGVFALCWLPLHIMNTVTLFCPACPQPPWLKDLAILLSHANSLINPLLYAWKLRDFRSAFRKILAPFFSTKVQRVSRVPSNRFSAFKLCCAVTSRPDVINDLTSDDKSASIDSSRGNQTHQTPIVGNKAIDPNNKPQSQSLHIKQGPRKCSGPSHLSEDICDQGCATSGTEVAVVSPQSAEEVLNANSFSLPDLNHNSRAASSDQIPMQILFLDGAGDALFNSPETTV